MFNSIMIIKLFYKVIFLFITTLSQDMFIVNFFIIYICIFNFYYLYVCTFIAIGNTSLMLLSINNKKLKPHQSDNQSCCLLQRYGQCTRKTMFRNMIISVQFRKKRCFRSYNQGYRKSGKS